MSIRFASKEDCAAIAEIYNHAVLHTAAIWNDQTVDASNRIAWYEASSVSDQLRDSRSMRILALIR